MSGLNNVMGRGVIPPVVHGALDYPLAAVLIVLAFLVGFWDDTTALLFYLIVGAGRLAATLATRFREPLPGLAELR